MKRAYVRPTMVGERFVANEYVAACGESRKVYKFNCDAPGGPLYYYPNFDGTVDGFVDYNWNGKQDRGEGVIVWRGPRNNNGHATTKINMREWETAKS